VEILGAIRGIIPAFCLAWRENALGFCEANESGSTLFLDLLLLILFGGFF